MARIVTREIEQIVYQQGLVSRRKARRVLKAILHAWRRAIWRGEVVEIPGGEVKAVFQRAARPNTSAGRKWAAAE